jgi:hypothetical protein
MAAPQVRVILIGDSIINNLEDKSGCEKRIFKRFGGKGFNWGIGGASTVARHIAF